MAMPEHLQELLDQLPQQHQRQDVLNRQLEDLAVFGSRLGMYDAADFIRDVVARSENPDSE